MASSLAAAAVVLSLLSGGALAAGDPGGSSIPEPKDPALERFGEASAGKDWATAQSVMREAVAREPGKADYHNLYAYAIRKGANPDMSLVFKHYNQALALDRKHRGAHEYIGEAYLMVGNVAKAKEHLAQLDKLCFFGCPEYTDLKKAIAAYEKQGGR
jgi:cytochrome c-type biogenesis protein CcmH/NrfG